MKNPAANTKPLLFKSQPELFRRDDVLDICLYDTTRDCDGGRWREKFRVDAGRQNWLETQIERTMFPSSVVIATTSIETVIYDATVAVEEDEEQPIHSVWANLSGPVPNGGRTLTAAANGMVFIVGRSGAQVDARTLYAFDLLTGHIFRFTSAGISLMHGGRTPQQWAEWGEFWPDATISTDTLPDAVILGLKVQPVFNGGDSARGLERPTVLLRYADRVVTINPDLTIASWTDSGFDTVNSADLGRDGTMIVSAGVDASTQVVYVVSPENRLRYLGSSALITGADWNDSVLQTAGATTKVVSTDIEHCALIRGTDVIMFGILGNGFVQQRMGSNRNSLTLYGSGGAAILAGDTAAPEDDIIWGADWTKVGSLGYLSAMPGAATRLWNGWSASNYLAKTGNPSALQPALGNWLISGLVRMDDLYTGTRVIVEYGYAPSGYSGSAIRVSIINNVLTLTITDDAFATTDVVADVDELPYGVPVHFAAMRYGSRILLFRDGILMADTAVTNAAASLSNGSGVWRVGLSVASTLPASAVSIGHIGICKPDYTSLDEMRRGFIRDTALANKNEEPYFYAVGSEDAQPIDLQYEPLMGEWYVLTDYGIQTTDGAVVTGTMYSADFGFNQDEAPTSLKLCNEGCRVAVLADYRLWLYGGLTFFDRSQFDQMFANVYSPAPAKEHTYRTKTTDNTTKQLLFIPIEKGCRKKFKVLAEVGQPWDVAGGEAARLQIEYVATRGWSGSVVLTESSQTTIYGSGLTITATAHQRGVYVEITGKAATVLDWLITLEASV